MKKFLLGLAMLSMTSLLFTACNKDGEEAMTEEETATEESSMVEPEKTEEAAMETTEAESEDGAVKVEAEVKAE